ncbi:hypothetical protein OIU77_029133 [Salix suchowensis]|uniref:Translation initiation factor 3 N-terminal domain-containing protein n=1 Tax=Salix suchowensis TaxID=1278906 RepID=A0ABQ9BK72_9ROSI|nr:hypothetical protein OIU77_029133 [Salix suchowensis]
MALWIRSNQSKINFLTNQLKIYCLQIPYDSSLKYTATSSRSRVLENPVWDFIKKHSEFCNNVRFFAAPVQAKVKKEEKTLIGPRLNEKITAPAVRLVGDEGHSVVSLREALERAKRLGLDLVEVQSNANPPVCKLINFNREKYKKELKEKERSKGKAGETLRKGDHKEVRFAAKTEQRDLEMKADMAKRLMERGYRVKCMVIGSRKKRPVTKAPRDGDPETDLDYEEFERKKEERELLALLSRFTSLIEDVSIVDSGPKAGKRMAYAIVRHVKFGSSKKGGGKKDELANTQPIASRSAPPKSHVMSKEEPAEFYMESEDDSGEDFDKVFNVSDDDKTPSINHLEGSNSVTESATSSVEFNVPKFSHTRSAHDVRNARLPLPQPEHSPGKENRYRRSEPGNHFPQTSMDNKGPGKQDLFKLEPQFSNQRRQPQPQRSATTSMGERKQVSPDFYASRNSKSPHETPKQGAASPETVKSASSYGIFSSAKAGIPGKQGSVANDSAGSSSAGGCGLNSNLPVSKSKSDDGVDQGGQKGFGIFSRGRPN